MDWLFSSATKLWTWRNYLHSCFPFNLLHVINGYNIFVSFHESGKIRKILRTCINQTYLPRDIWGEKSRLKKKKKKCSFKVKKKKKSNSWGPRGKKKKKKTRAQLWNISKIPFNFFDLQKKKVLNLVKMFKTE